MAEYRSSSHTVYNIKYHFVWITKYRYKILKGSIGADHVYMLLSCPTDMSLGQIMQYLKERSSKLLQEDFPELRKKYWGQHMWGRGFFCGTVGAVDAETIRKYIENQGKEETDNFTIEEQ